MSSAGVPLRVIQEISGHRSLQALQRYLEVSELEQEGADRVSQFLKYRRLMNQLNSWTGLIIFEVVIPCQHPGFRLLPFLGS